jgi:acid phosphatase type 7
LIGAALALSLALAGGGADAGRPAEAPAPQQEQRAVVWALGDGADGSAVAHRLARRIERDRPDAFLYLGDVYPGGTAADYASNYKPIYGPLDPITWPTPGNHEWWSREQGYFPYWREHGRARPWYRFRLAGWELLSLNSEAPHAAGSPQLRWLERKLDAGDGNCRLAFWHRPRFSADTMHGDAPDLAPFWSALRGRARLVLNGHGHALMRYRPRAGIAQYVAGAGGQKLYGLNPDGRLAFGRSGVTGALRITLSPGKATLAFRSVDGELLDRSRANCRR